MRYRILHNMAEALLGSCDNPDERSLAWAISDELGERFDHQEERVVFWIYNLWNGGFEDFFSNNVEAECQIFQCEECGWWFETYEMSCSEFNQTCIECNPEEDEDEY